MTDTLTQELIPLMKASNELQHKLHELLIKEITDIFSVIQCEDSDIITIALTAMGGALADFVTMNIKAEDQLKSLKVIELCLVDHHRFLKTDDEL